MTAHPYRGDGIADHRGQDRCAVPGCGRPRTNAIHQLPDAPEQAEHRRRAGDREDTR